MTNNWNRYSSLAFNNSMSDTPDMDHDKAEFSRVTRILWDLKGIKHFHKILLLSENSPYLKYGNKHAQIPRTSHLFLFPTLRFYICSIIHSSERFWIHSTYISLSIMLLKLLPAALKQHLGWCFCFQPCLQQSMFYTNYIYTCIHPHSIYN